jgi:hypothetical protein
VNDEQMNEAPKPASTGTSVSAPNATPSPAAGGVKPFEQWAKAKRTEAWWVAGAAMHAGWAVGREVTEADYDAAVDAAKKVEVR